MGKVERKVSILEVLSNATEATRPSDIGEIIGESALNTGRYLSDMAESGLVQKPDKKKAFYDEFVVLCRKYKCIVSDISGCRWVKRVEISEVKSYLKHLGQRLD